MKATYLMALIILSATACSGLQDSNLAPDVAVGEEAKPDVAHTITKKCDSTKHLASFGNQHVRYFDVCKGDIGIIFQATPNSDGKYSVSYHVLETPCASADVVNGFLKPAALQASVEDQVSTIRAEINPVVMNINKKCQLDIEIGDILDGQFENDYMKFGDGWWLSAPSITPIVTVQ